MTKVLLCLSFAILMSGSCGNQNAISGEHPQSIDAQAMKAVKEVLNRLVLDDVLPTADGGENSRIQFVVVDGVPRTRTNTAGFKFQMVVGNFNFASYSGSSVPSYWFSGAEHHYLAVLDFSEQPAKNFIVAGYKFEGDPEYPLTMKLKKDKGYVYLCGRGTISHKDGRVYRLGQKDTIKAWLVRMKSQDTLDREGAAQALGYLSKSAEEKQLAISTLVQALKDTSPPVRRDAAEALGKIGDGQVISKLQVMTDQAKETDEWVREVAKEAVERIKSRK